MLAEVDFGGSMGTVLQKSSPGSWPAAVASHMPYQVNSWLLEIPTGEVSMAASSFVVRLGGWFVPPFAEMLPPVTGTPAPYGPTVRINLVACGRGGFCFTSRPSELWLDEWPEAFYQPPTQPPVPLFTTRVDDAVARAIIAPGAAEHESLRLRELSGLEPSRLAEVIGVTKQAYYDWLNGKPAKSSHRERLLEVLVLCEEAAERLGSPDAVNAWLLKPVAPGERSPLKLLIDHQDNLFRAALLQSQDHGRVARPLASRPKRAISRPEHEVKRIGRQRRRAAWLEDYE